MGNLWYFLIGVLICEHDKRCRYWIMLYKITICIRIWKMEPLVKEDMDLTQDLIYLGEFIKIKVS